MGQPHHQRSWPQVSHLTAPINPTNEAISITALQLSRVHIYKNCTIYKIKAGFMARILHFNNKKVTIKMISRLLALF